MGIQRIREIFAAFEAGNSPGELYAALEEISLDDEAVLQALFEGFHCTEWRGALAVTKALQKSTPRPDLAVPKLIKALGHRESSVRSGASEALGAYGAAAESAIPTLLDALRKEPDAYQQSHHVKALGAIAWRPQVVIPVLVGILEKGIDSTDHPYLPEEAAEAIGAFGPAARSTLPILLAALKAEDHGIRGAVVKAIALLKAPAKDYLVPLLSYLETAESYEANAALEHFAKEPGVAIPFVDALIDRDVSLLGFVYGLDRPALERLGAKLTTDSRSRAARLLAMPGLEADFLCPALIAVLDSNDPDVLDALGNLGSGRSDAIDALIAFERKATDDLKDRARQILRRLGRPVPPPPGGVDLSRVQIHLLTAIVAMGSSMQIGSTLWLPAHKVVAWAPKEDWANDEDEIGLLRIETKGAAYFRLPVKFPLKPNGANGAKRRVKLAGTYGEAILLQVESPFSDSRGWGKDNYLYLYRPDSGWSQHGVDDIHPDEDPATSVCHGELELRFEAERVRLVSDTTPYHLDDWEHSEQELGALREGESVAAADKTAVEFFSDYCWGVGDAPLKNRAGARHLLYDVGDFIRKHHGTYGHTHPMAALEHDGKLAIVGRIYKKGREDGVTDTLFVWSLKA